MNWLEELKKAAFRAEDLQDAVGRRISLKLTIAGLTIEVGDPTKRLNAYTLDYITLHEKTQDGTLPDVVELIARDCAAKLEAAGG